MTRRVALAALVIAILGIVAVLLVRESLGPPEEPGPGEVPSARTGAAGGIETPSAGPRDDAVPRARPRAATRLAPASGDAATPSDPDAEPPPPGTVAGLVLRAEDETPVAGAVVRWWAARPPMTSPEWYDERDPVHAANFDLPPLGTTSTDARGAFEFPAPGDSPWHVVVTADGLGIAAQRGWGAKRVPSLWLDAAGRRRWVVREETGGRPIPGAVVRVFGADSNAVPSETVLCDTAGRGETELAGREDVLVSAEGFAARWTKFPSDDEVHEVLLPRGAVISGRVEDAAGRPVAGAVVACISFAHGEDWPLGLASGADGGFRFLVPDDGEVRPLHAEAEGFAPAEALACPGETQVRLRLDAAGSISGHAVDARGKLLEGFEVEVDQLRGRVTGPGSFEIAPLPPGLHEVEVEVPGDGGKGYGSTMVALRAGERRTGVRVVVADPSTGSETRVRVADPEGAPVARVQVYWRGRTWTRGFTAADGTATVKAHGPPGTRGTLVTTIRDDLRWVPGPGVEAVEGTPGGEAVVAVTVLPARKVRIRVLGHDGQELTPFASLHIAEDAGVGLFGQDLFLADGARFVLTVNTPGRATSTVACSAADAVDGVLTVRLPRGPVLRGRVTVAGDAPRGSLHVVATVLRGPQDRVSGSFHAAAPDGAFAITGLPEGEGFLEVRESDDRLERVPFTMGRSDVELGEVRVGPFVPLTGVVVDDRDVPVARVAVYVSSSPRFHGSTEVDAAGRFRILVPEGSRVQVAAGDGGDRESHPVDAIASRDAAPLTLRLERVARLLVFASFAEASGVSVRARPAAGGDERELGRSTWGAQPPVFGIELPPGAWDLRISHGGREWRRSVSVGSGDVAELTLDE